MRASVGRVVVWEVLLLLLLTAAACDKNNTPPPPSFGGRGPGGSNSPIGPIMKKIGGGLQSLNKTLEGDLQADPPPWETIQPQAREYAELAGSLSKYDPPKGSQESWTKAVASFAESASALQRAADAKDRMAAQTAQSQLSKSCMGCHREHRPGPGGPPRPPQP